MADINKLLTGSFNNANKIIKKVEKLFSEQRSSASSNTLINQTINVSNQDLKIEEIVNEKGNNEFAKRIESANSYELYVGIPQNKSTRQSQSINNAELAYIHTHGVANIKARQQIEEQIAKGFSYEESRQRVFDMWMLEHGSPAYAIPPRPIIEPAIREHKEEITQILVKIYAKIALGKEDEAIRDLNALGMMVSDFVHKRFRKENNDWPPNAPSTIKAKGSDVPLVDTGSLRDSISYVVKTPKG